MSTATAEELEIRRDEKGRPIADDGWPVSGLATINEVVTASGLSRSRIYSMLGEQIPTRKFGRSVRVEWNVVRRLFLTPTEAEADVE